MNLKRFIKVTPKDSTKHIVLLAGNESFYRSQGAIIEQPTEEEVLEFFPQLAKEIKPLDVKVEKAKVQPKRLQLLK
ncbi:MAG: hypothetical protein IKU78_00570 [Paludibacteraceae bacterium]|nr:hypothetical protein [Paludibacteraceae bacterium]